MESKPAPELIAAEDLENVGELLVGDQIFRVAGRIERTANGGLRFRERDRDGYASSWIDVRESAVIGVRYNDRPK